MLFNIIKALINKGRTEGLAKKIDVFYADSKLTDKEYTELGAVLEELE